MCFVPVWTGTCRRNTQEFTNKIKKCYEVTVFDNTIGMTA